MSLPPVGGQEIVPLPLFIQVIRLNSENADQHSPAIYINRSFVQLPVSLLLVV
jgi:hypothetical protein